MAVAAVTAAMEIEMGDWASVLEAGGAVRDLALYIFHDYCVDDVGGTVEMRQKLRAYVHPAEKFMVKHQRGTILGPIPEEDDDTLIIDVTEADIVSDDSEDGSEVTIIKEIPGRGAPVVKVEPEEISKPLANLPKGWSDGPCLHQPMLVFNGCSCSIMPLP